MSRDALIFYSEFDDPEAWKRTLDAELPDLDFHTDPGHGRSGERALRARLEAAEGLLRALSESEARHQSRRRRGFAGRPRRPAGRADHAPVGRRHGAVDDAPTCCSRSSAMRATFLFSSARSDAANGITCIRARCPTSASACWDWANSAPRRRRPWPGIGFDVRGWSRSQKSIDGVTCSAGLETLDAFLADTEILVILLPLTPDTRGLLDARRLSLLPKGAKAHQCLARRGDRRGRLARGSAIRRRSRKPRSTCSRSSRCRRITPSGAWRMC